MNSDFWVGGKRYRVFILEARTKWQNERAETKIRDSIFDVKFGKQIVAPTLREFFEKTSSQMYTVATNDGLRRTGEHWSA